MLSYMTYECPVCGRTDKDPKRVLICEAGHRGLRDPELAGQWADLKLALSRAAPADKTRISWGLADFEMVHKMLPEIGHMSASDILAFWADYTHFDPDQTRFNLCNGEFTLHQCNKNLVKFAEYDPTGALGVIYARTVFRSLMKDSRTNLLEILDKPHGLDEEKEMYRIFCSKDIQLAEKALLDSIDNLVLQAAGKTMIGQRDPEQEKSALISSVTAIVEQLSACNVDLFLRGGKMAPVTHFSTHIHIFERLSECLLALEQAQDGMYLCYINNSGTVDGYFGFYIKSNGNILSINERVDEAYPGQHKNSRNGRWTEEKKFELFPYEYIFQFSDYDYKGYAKKQMIDQERLAFFQLPAGGYMPLILAMVLLNNKYHDFDTTTMPLQFVDSMMSVNAYTALPGVEALTIPEHSALATLNKNFTLDIDSQSVLTGSYAQRLESKDRNYKERGQFQKEPNIFVQLYGDGFQLDEKSLLKANQHLLALPDPWIPEKERDVTPNCEFVGTRARMEVIAYMQACEQLSEYIRDRMFEKFQAYGGMPAVRAWYRNLLDSQKDHLFKLCVLKSEGILNGSERNTGSADWMDTGERTPLQIITRLDECKGYVSSVSWIWSRRSAYPFNETKYNSRGTPEGIYECPITDTKASIFFLFQFYDWKDLAGLFGEENIPDIVKGWQRDRITGSNPLLNATDYCLRSLGTVFEEREIQNNRRLWTKKEWSHEVQRISWSLRAEDYMPDNVLKESTEFEFNFAIGFSKRGFRSLTKQVMAEEEAQARQEQAKTATQESET